MHINISGYFTVPLEYIIREACRNNSDIKFVWLIIHENCVILNINWYQNMQKYRSVLYYNLKNIEVIKSQLYYSI